MLTPPLLWPSIQTPASEIPTIKDLNANLLGVTYNVEAWATAFRLYQFAKQCPSGASAADSRSWKFIAAHECVHQLHHLKERLEKIKGFKIRACPTLTSSIDSKQLRAASKLLDEYFPDIDQLRHAIAHAGANDVLPGKHLPEHGYLLVGFIDEDRYSSPYQGIDRSLSLTEDTLERIREVASSFLLVFEPAAKLLQHQGHLE